MKALRLPAPHALRLMVSPAGSMGSRIFVSARALPATCRPVAGPGSLLVTLAVPFQRFSSWARTGPHRFPGDPSRGSAPFQDPGRPVAPRLSRCFRCCLLSQHTKGVVGLHDFEAYRAASPHAVYASRRALPHAMQDSLPAGGLRLCRAGVEPAGSQRKVSVHVIPLSRAYPVASWAHSAGASSTSSPTSRWAREDAARMRAADLTAGAGGGEADRCCSSTSSARSTASPPGSAPRHAPGAERTGTGRSQGLDSGRAQEAVAPFSGGQGAREPLLQIGHDRLPVGPVRRCGCRRERRPPWSDSTIAGSEWRANEAISRSSSPLACRTSLRPRARMVRWRTRFPSRTLSTR